MLELSELLSSSWCASDDLNVCNRQSINLWEHDSALLNATICSNRVTDIFRWGYIKYGQVLQEILLLFGSPCLLSILMQLLYTTEILLHKLLKTVCYLQLHFPYFKVSSRRFPSENVN